MIPVFGTAAILIAPLPSLQSAGYVAGNTLAAQNLNYYLFHLTKEMNNLLTSGGISQSTLDDTQITQAIQALINKSQYSSMTAAAGYTPAANDVVEMLPDGTIRKAKRFNSVVFVSGVSIDLVRIARVDATHVVALWNQTTALNAQVFSIDPISLLPSAVGSPQLVFTFTTAVAPFDMKAVDGTHVILAYTTAALVNSTINVRTLTVNVSTGAITVNAAVTGASAFGVQLCEIPGTANYLMTYTTATTSISAAVVTLAGTVPTINAATANTVTATGNTNSAVYPVPAVTADGKMGAVLYFGTASPFTLFLSAWLISGTSTTANGEVSTGQPTAGGSKPAIYGFDWGPADVGIAFVSASAAYGGFLSPTRGGASTPQSIAPINGTPDHFLPISNHSFLRAVDRTNNVFLLITDSLQLGSTGNAGGVQTFHNLLVRRKAGQQTSLAAFDFGDEVKINTPGPGGGNGQSHGDVLSSGIIVLVDNEQGSAQNAQMVAMRRRNTILGVVIDATGKVQTMGTYVTTGLTAGAEYFCDDNGNLTTTRTEVHIGFAISTTQLVLSVVPGV